MQAGFLWANLSKWIPSLRGRDIEIDRAHRVYDGGRGSDRPRTLIFRVLRWHDRSDILKGARQAYPVKCAQNNVTLLFFPDFSRLQRSGERHLVRFWRRWQHLVSSPSSSIQRWLSYGTKENREASIPSESGGFYQFHVSAEVVCRGSAGDGGGSSGRCFFSSAGGRDGRDGLGPSCPEGDDSRMNMDAS